VLTIKLISPGTLMSVITGCQTYIAKCSPINLVTATIKTLVADFTITDFKPQNFKIQNAVSEKN
jgi:hypothetical protein